MKAKRQRTEVTQVGRGKICAVSAAMITLLLVLVICPGCDDSIRTELRQGAYDVFETGLNTFYSELTTGVTEAVQAVGPTGLGGSTTNTTAGTSTSTDTGS